MKNLKFLNIYRGVQKSLDAVGYAQQLLYTLLNA